MFFVEDNRPYFSPDGNVKAEIKTEMSQGFEIVVNTKPEQLVPNKYYLFGFINTPIVIRQFVSYSRNHVETYSGEFTVVKGGSVKFPSSVKWVEEPNFEEGYTYQFEIKNGIGHFLKVK